MTTGWKYGRPMKEKLMRLEEPGKELLFDLDKGLVEEVTSKFDIAAVARSFQGREEKEIYNILEKLGNDVMRLIIGLADTKYMDRTAEMVEKVAKQTGISFPHRLERYVELSILGLRPTDRWNITKATTKELVLQVSLCSVLKVLEAAGVKGLPCQGFCFASFNAAAEKTGDKIKTEMSKSLPQDGMCEFHISI